MARKDDDQRYPAEETDERLRKILRGAFTAHPTPLKDIPKKRSAHRPKDGVPAAPASEKKPRR